MSDSRLTLLGVGDIVLGPGGFEDFQHVVQAGFIPLIVNKMGHPVVVRRDNGGQEVFDYMAKITEGAELNGQFAWEGDEIVIANL